MTADAGMPTLSIIMPVHDTGPLLLDSVRSVVAQTLFAEEGDDYWELLIVDDASTDAATRSALAEAQRSSRSVRVLQNARARGPAGARNTGVFAARGRWIAFLDSDDLWYPDFLRLRRDAFLGLPDARWRAAHFDVGDALAHTTPAPLSRRSPCLYRYVAADHEAGRVSVLRRPVDVLLQCGCIQVMTVQVERELIQAVGGFDETLPSAEDYDLWLRLAVMTDLAIAPIDAGVYRTRGGSLTKSGRPMYFCEDRMLLAAKADHAFDPYRTDLDERLTKVYGKFCFHYRAQRDFDAARRYAWRLVRLAPRSGDGWRQLVAALLRR